MTLAADRATPGIVRQRVRRWLELLAWPADQVDDIELAVNEAVSDAVEHAHPAGADGGVVVEATVETVPGDGGGRRARLVVRDGGRWPGTRPDGRGLRIMTATMDEVGIHRGPGGTTVTLVSAAVPDVPPG